VVLTFFSPSGYEVRKNYPGADYIYYLPADTARNAQDFIDIIKPQLVFFIKYEFWYFFLKTLKDKKIPVYLISGIFRRNQVFFKRYGLWYRKILLFFEHIFVQDTDSETLLKQVGIKKCTVSGDTRFDRVGQITDTAHSVPQAASFKAKRKVFIAGSSWPADEELISQFINEHPNQNWCYIIAPHEIHESHLRNIEDQFTTSIRHIRFSQIGNEPLSKFDVLIIDNFGMLTSLYAYGDIGYIGGGFGKSIHNTLEAATFSMPVIFGPKFHKFREAKDLIDFGGGFTIDNYQTFEKLLTSLMVNSAKRLQAGETAGIYVRENRGAVDFILSCIEKQLNSLLAKV
jgi:3-deoxy-D-manno-octulosonic-acid transferase